MKQTFSGEGIYIDTKTAAAFGEAFDVKDHCWSTSNIRHEYGPVVEDKTVAEAEDSSKAGLLLEE